MKQPTCIIWPVAVPRMLVDTQSHQWMNVTNSWVGRVWAEAWIVPAGWCLMAPISASCTFCEICTKQVELKLKQVPNMLWQLVRSSAKGTKGYFGTWTYSGLIHTVELFTVVFTKCDYGKGGIWVFYPIFAFPNLRVWTDSQGTWEIHRYTVHLTKQLQY